MNKHVLMRSTEKFNRISMAKAKLEGKTRCQFLNEWADKLENELIQGCKIDQKINRKNGFFPKL